MSARQPPPTHGPATTVTIVGTLATISTLLAVRRRTRLPATVVATTLWIVWGVMEWLRRRRNKLQGDAGGRGGRPEPEEIQKKELNALSFEVPTVPVPSSSTPAPAAPSAR